MSKLTDIRFPEIRFPAEWENQEAVWLGFPHNKADWPGKFSPIPWVFAEIIKNISFNQKVRLLVISESHRKAAKRVLQYAGADTNNVEFYITATDRGWLRDISPFYVKDENNNTCFIHFEFDGWSKYDNYKKDRKVPAFISKKLKHELIEAVHNNKPVVLEGGAIDINGKGTLITTEECLLDPDTQTRNPGFTKKDYEDVFSKYLGIKKIIWLANGIKGDDTHGHVDDLCRFINNDTVLIADEENSADENHYILKENIERLQSETLQDGSKVNFIKLPMPAPFYFRGERLPASYANFLITNNTVLVPTFNDTKDRQALGIIAECFPSRIVTGINSTDLVWGLGTIHCLTREQPE